MHQHQHHYHQHGHHHCQHFHHLKKVRGGRWLAQVWVETCSSAHRDHSALRTEVWFEILRLVAVLPTLHAPDDKLVSSASLDSINQVVVRTRAVPVSGFHLINMMSITIGHVSTYCLSRLSEPNFSRLTILWLLSVLVMIPAVQECLRVCPLGYPPSICGFGTKNGFYFFHIFL